MFADGAHAEDTHFFVRGDDEFEEALARVSPHCERTTDQFVLKRGEPTSAQEQRWGDRPLLTSVNGNLVWNPQTTAVLLVHADAGNLGLQEHDRRNVFVCHVSASAEALGTSKTDKPAQRKLTTQNRVVLDTRIKPSLPIFTPNLLHRKPSFNFSNIHKTHIGSQVTNRENIRGGGASVVLFRVDVPTFVEFDAAGFEVQFVDARLAADGDEGAGDTVGGFSAVWVGKGV